MGMLDDIVTRITLQGVDELSAPLAAGSASLQGLSDTATAMGGVVDGAFGTISDAAAGVAVKFDALAGAVGASAAKVDSALSGAASAAAAAAARIDTAMTGAAGGMGRLATATSVASGKVASALHGIADSAIVTSDKVEASNGKIERSNGHAAESYRILYDAARASGLETGEAGLLAQKGLLGLGAAVGVVGVGIGVFAIKSAADFQESMSKIHGFAGASALDMKYYNAEVLKMSSEFGVSAKNVAAGLYYVVSAGFKGADAMNVLKYANMAAAASGASVETVANATTSALKAYNLTGSHAAEVTDILSKGVVMGKTTFEELAASIGRPLTIAPALGASLSSVVAVIADLTTHGYSSQLAAQGLTSSMSAMLAPTSLQTKAMNALGLSTDVVTQVHKHGLIPTMEHYYQTAVNGNPTLQNLIEKHHLTAKAALNLATQMQHTNNRVKDVFGNVRALSVVLSLASDHFKTVKDNAKAAGSAAGTTAHAWAVASEDFNKKLDIAKVSIQNVAIALGQTLLPAVSDLAGGVADLAKKAAPVAKAFGDWIASVIEAVKQDKALKDDIGHFKSAFEDLQDTMEKVSGSTKKVKEAAEPTGSAINHLGDSFQTAGEKASESHKKVKTFGDYLRDGLKKELEGDTNFAADATKVFSGSVLYVSNIVDYFNEKSKQVSGGMTAFSAGVKQSNQQIAQSNQSSTADFDQWQRHIFLDMQSAADSVGNATGRITGDIGSFIGNTLGATGSFIGKMAGSIGTGTGQMTGSFGSFIGRVTGDMGAFIGRTTGDVGAWIGRITGDIGAGVGHWWTSLGDGLGRMGSSIGTWITTSIKTIGDGLGQIGNNIQAWLKSVEKWFADLPGNLGSSLGTLISTVVKAFVDTAAGAMSELGKLKDRLGSWIGDRVTQFLNAAHSWVASMVTGLGDKIQSLISEATKIATAIFNTIKTFFTSHNPFSGLVSQAKDAVGAITGFLGGIGSGISSAVGGHLGSAGGSATGGGGYTRGDQYGKYGASSANYLSSGDAAMLGSLGVPYSGGLMDTDFATGSGNSKPFRLPPGGSYQLIAQKDGKLGPNPSTDVGGYEVWRNKINGGVEMFLHALRESGLKVGSTVAGGTTVGMSGHALTHQFGNDPSFWHLCVVNDAGQREWLSGAQMTAAQSNSGSHRGGGGALAAKQRGGTWTPTPHILGGEHNLPGVRADYAFSMPRGGEHYAGGVQTDYNTAQRNQYMGGFIGTNTSAGALGALAAQSPQHKYGSFGAAQADTGNLSASIVKLTGSLDKLSPEVAKTMKAAIVAEAAQMQGYTSTYNANYRQANSDHVTAVAKIYSTSASQTATHEAAYRAAEAANIQSGITANAAAHEKYLKARGKIDDRFTTAQINERTSAQTARNNADRTQTQALARLSQTEGKRQENSNSALSKANTAANEKFKEDRKTENDRFNGILKDHGSATDAQLRAHTHRLKAITDTHSDKLATNLEKHPVKMAVVTGTHITAFERITQHHKNAFDNAARAHVVLFGKATRQHTLQMGYLTQAHVKDYGAANQKLTDANNKWLAQHKTNLQTNLDKSQAGFDKHIAGLKSGLTTHLNGLSAANAALVAKMKEALTDHALWDGLAAHLSNVIGKGTKDLAYQIYKGTSDNTHGVRANSNTDGGPGAIIQVANNAKLIASLGDSIRKQKDMTDSMIRATAIAAVAAGDFGKAMSAWASQAATRVSDALGKLTYDLSYHKGAVEADTAAYIRAKTAQDANTEGMLQAQLTGDRAMGIFSTSLAALATKLGGATTQALDKLTYDLTNHSGSVTEDTAAYVSARTAQEANTRSVVEGQLAGDRAMGLFGTTLADTAKTLSTAYTVAKDKYVADSISNSAALGDDTASLIAAKQAEQENTDKVRAATDSADRAMGDFSTSIATIKNSVDGPLAKATDKLIFDEINNQSAVAADTVAVLAAQVGVDKFSEATNRAKIAVMGLYDKDVAQAQALAASTLKLYDNAYAAGVTGPALKVLFDNAVDAGVGLQALTSIPGVVSAAITAKFAAMPAITIPTNTAPTTSNTNALGSNTAGLTTNTTGLTTNTTTVGANTTGLTTNTTTVGTNTTAVGGLTTQTNAASLTMPGFVGSLKTGGTALAGIATPVSTATTSIQGLATQFGIGTTILSQTTGGLQGTNVAIDSTKVAFGGASTQIGAIKDPMNGMIASVGGVTSALLGMGIKFPILGGVFQGLTTVLSGTTAAATTNTPAITGNTTAVGANTTAMGGLTTHTAAATVTMPGFIGSLKSGGAAIQGVVIPVHAITTSISGLATQLGVGTTILSQTTGGLQATNVAVNGTAVAFGGAQTQISGIINPLAGMTAAVQGVTGGILGLAGQFPVLGGVTQGLTSVFNGTKDAVAATSVAVQGVTTWIIDWKPAITAHKDAVESTVAPIEGLGTGLGSLTIGIHGANDAFVASAKAAYDKARADYLDAERSGVTGDALIVLHDKAITLGVAFDQAGDAATNFDTEMKTAADGIKLTAKQLKAQSAGPNLYQWTAGNGPNAAMQGGAAGVGATGTGIIGSSGTNFASSTGLPLGTSMATAQAGTNYSGFAQSGLGYPTAPLTAGKLNVPVTGNNYNVPVVGTNTGTMPGGPTGTSGTITGVPYINGPSAPTGTVYYDPSTKLFVANGGWLSIDMLNNNSSVNNGSGGSYQNPNLPVGAYMSTTNYLSGDTPSGGLGPGGLPMGAWGQSSSASAANLGSASGTIGPPVISPITTARLNQLKLRTQPIGGSTSGYVGPSNGTAGASPSNPVYVTPTSMSASQTTAMQAQLTQLQAQTTAAQAASNAQIAALQAANALQAEQLAHAIQDTLTLKELQRQNTEALNLSTHTGAAYTSTAQLMDQAALQNRGAT